MTTRPGVQLVTVTVRRTGGIGGIGRTWRADLPAADLPVLPDTEQEPAQDAAPHASPGADRFVWTITVTRGSTAARDEPISVCVTDHAVDDDVRALIQRVRDEGRVVPPQR